MRYKINSGYLRLKAEIKLKKIISYTFVIFKKKKFIIKSKTLSSFIIYIREKMLEKHFNSIKKIKVNSLTEMFKPIYSKNLKLKKTFNKSKK
ncbi:hypothetical protein BpHYR1_043689 [Brachionus plicatilis]|uniref:Uncharacterized protein n=1 Tax=Brachionus plicatilis TaxID=10195 RepID=A0A3M7RQX4_BRAPC|nr:hypothetical protein BpHYR1_043689 [Brachionus plicatilis]